MTDINLTVLTLPQDRRQTSPWWAWDTVWLKEPGHRLPCNTARQGHDTKLSGYRRFSKVVTLSGY